MYAQNQHIKARVQAVLQWDDLKFGEFQAAMGELYLQEELDCSADLRRVIMQSKLFWGWWLNHWVMRDVVWLQHNPRYQGYVTDASYKLHHNPRAVVYKPHSTILRTSYAEMMGKLIKNVVND